MNDIIGIISTVEDDAYQGKAHKKVTLEDGQVLKVKYGREGFLKAKWGLLQEGKAIKFTMKEFTKDDGVKIPFVSDIATELKPPQSDQNVLDEHQEVIDKSGAKTSTPIAPQEQGMWFKEIGELYRAGLIKKDTTEGLALIATYFARMREVMGIETARKPAPKKAEPFIEPDDVPF